MNNSTHQPCQTLDLEDELENQEPTAEDLEECERIADSLEVLESLMQEWE